MLFHKIVGILESAVGTIMHIDELIWKWKYPGGPINRPLRRAGVTCTMAWSAQTGGRIEVFTLFTGGIFSIQFLYRFQNQPVLHSFDPLVQTLLRIS